MVRRSWRGKGFRRRYGPWALVTGASAGIGRAFAESLAAIGLNVVIVARRRDLLEALARQLISRFDVQVRVLSSDLSRGENIEPLWRELDDLDIGLLVNNAGAPGFHGRFIERDWDDIALSLYFNTAIQARMIHSAVLRMKQRGSAGIVQVSSITGLTPVPYMSEYAASKAYQLALSESLHFELKDHGIDMLAVSPGATRSERIDYGMEPADVVVEALNGLGRKACVVPGRRNWLQTIRFRYLNTRLGAIRQMGRFQKSRLVD